MATVTAEKRAEPTLWEKLAAEEELAEAREWERILAELPDDSELLSEEPEMESSLHQEQAVILQKSLERWWQDRDDFFIGVNLSIYFNLRQAKAKDFRGPDIFVALGTERRPRVSWVLWNEDGKYPDLIIELLSDSTASKDRGGKKHVYQNIFRTPEYFWFHPQTLEFAGWRLGGLEYQSIQPNEQGWLWSNTLELYLGITDGKLRYFTNQGLLVPTPEEGEKQALQLAEQERQRAEQEKQRADLLAEKLRALGIDPASL